MGAANKRIIITNEDDDVKFSPETLGSKVVLPVEIVNSSGDQEDFITEPTTPTIYNLPLADSNTEYSQALPSGTKKLKIRSRLFNTSLKIAFSSGGSGSTYFTVPFGGTLSLAGISFTGVTVYVQSSRSSNVCEIIAFT